MSALPDPSQVTVLVPAAGSGERLGRGPKALLPLAGRPLVEWVAAKAMQLAGEVVVACAPGMPAPAGTLRVEGGATRQQSVERLVAAATRPWIVLWDAASPFASVDLARQVLRAAADTGAATACLPSEVPCLLLEQGRVRQALPAGQAAASSTPQAFRRDLLCAAVQRAAREGVQAQSTVQVVLHAGHAVAAVPADKLCIKLTTPEDWVLAEALHARLSR